MKKTSIKYILFFIAFIVFNTLNAQINSKSQSVTTREVKSLDSATSNELTFSANVIPKFDDSLNLGSETKRWKKIYTEELNYSNKKTYFKHTSEYPYFIKPYVVEGDTMIYTQYNWRLTDTTIKGDTLWFSPTGIDSAGRGNSNTPLKSLAYGYNNYPNAKKYYLLPGTYKYEHGFRNTDIKRELSIKKWQNGSAKVLLTNRIYPVTTKKAEASFVYKYYSTDSSMVMIDTMYKDIKGYFMPLLKVNKILSLLDATPGSYYWETDTIYYHRYLNTGPTSDSGFFVNAFISAIGSSDYHALYLENLNVWGGSFTISAVNADTLRKKYFTSVNCFFGYAAGDVYFNAGNVYTTSKLCTVVYGDDCFNYEDNGTIYNSADFLEYYCTAYGATSRIKSSSLTANASNGSTSHRYCTGMRLKGNYEGSFGPNVADINGTITINIGCYTAGSTGSTYPTATGISMGFECGTITSAAAAHRRDYAFGTRGTYINCTSTDSIGLWVRNGTASISNFIGDTIVPALSSTPPAHIDEDRYLQYISNFGKNDEEELYPSNVARSGLATDLIGIEKYVQYNDSVTKFATKADISTLSTASYSGTFSQIAVVGATSFVVNIGATLPNTNFKVLVTPNNALSSELFYITNKTTTAFQVEYKSSLTGDVSFSWQVIK